MGTDENAKKKILIGTRLLKSSDEKPKKMSISGGAPTRNPKRRVSLERKGDR